MSFYYIASPYTHEDPVVRTQRFHETMKFTANLMKLQIPVYSPIVHCHELSILHELPHTFDYWQKMNHAMLNASKATIILTIPGWEKSNGVEDEINYSKKLKHPIYFAWPEPDWFELFQKNLIKENY